MAKKKTAKQEAPVTDDVAEEYDATRYTPWVPGNMPAGGKANSTEQLNDHPTEHNHSAAAISDIVDRFADLRLYVPAANSCGVDGDLQVDGQFIAKGSGSPQSPRFQIGDAAGLGMYGSVGSQWLRFATGDVWRLQVSASGVVVQDELKVVGQVKAQNGSAAAPAYSFTSDTKSGFYLADDTVAIVSGGKNVANFSKAGISFPDALPTTPSKPNVVVNDFGQLFRSTAVQTDSADLSRLETIIETLSARIDQLEARLETGTADA